jgi:hypothetical protein
VTSKLQSAMVKFVFIIALLDTEIVWTARINPYLDGIFKRIEKQKKGGKFGRDVRRTNLIQLLNEKLLNPTNINEALILPWSESAAGHRIIPIELCGIKAYSVNPVVNSCS